MLIYKITNRVNGKIYIGATTNYRQRIQIHKSSVKKHLYPIAIALAKYGWDNFEFTVLETEPNKEVMYEREKYYIALYDSMNNGYNGTTGGINHQHSEKTIKSFYGHKVSLTTREKMRQKRVEYHRKNPDIIRGQSNPMSKTNRLKRINKAD